MKTNEHSIILIDPAAHTGGPVEIDFDDCDTEAKIVGWIQHLCPKIWVTKGCDPRNARRNGVNWYL